MITRVLLSIGLLLSAAPLLADGYPFSTETHEVTGPNIRIPLSETQETEVSATGRVTFSKEQLEWLRLIYPKIPGSLKVISSTVNDGLDTREPNPVDCIWTAPEEVAVTLKEKLQPGDYTFYDGKEDADAPDLRISPKGLLYHAGKETTLEKALEIVRTAKKQTYAINGERAIRVTVPPPYRSKGSEYSEWNKNAADVLTALQKYGSTLKVTVYSVW